jgi:hypothetical protein
MNAVDYRIEHADYIGTFDGEVRTIRTTVLTLPNGSTYQWFPELPDAYKKGQQPE